MQPEVAGEFGEGVSTTLIRLTDSVVPERLVFDDARREERIEGLPMSQAFAEWDLVLRGFLVEVTADAPGEVLGAE